jgi:hypothetical protein
MAYFDLVLVWEAKRLQKAGYRGCHHRQNLHFRTFHVLRHAAGLSSSQNNLFPTASVFDEYTYLFSMSSCLSSTNNFSCFHGHVFHLQTFSSAPVFHVSSAPVLFVFCTCLSYLTAPVFHLHLSFICTWFSCAVHLSLICIFVSSGGDVHAVVKISRQNASMDSNNPLRAGQNLKENT